MRVRLTVRDTVILRPFDRDTVGDCDAVPISNNPQNNAFNIMLITENVFKKNIDETAQLSNFTLRQLWESILRGSQLLT